MASPTLADITVTTATDNLRYFTNKSIFSVFQLLDMEEVFPLDSTVRTITGQTPSAVFMLGLKSGAHRRLPSQLRRHHRRVSTTYVATCLPSNIIGMVGLGPGLYVFAVIGDHPYVKSVWIDLASPHQDERGRWTFVARGTGSFGHDPALLALENADVFGEGGRMDVTEGLNVAAYVQETVARTQDADWDVD